MSNSLKVVRSNGRITDYLDVKLCEYCQVDDLIELELSIDGGSSATHDMYVESININQGDSAFLLNVQGNTIDIIRPKKVY